MTDAERLQRESGAGPSTGLVVRTVGIQVRACRLKEASLVLLSKHR
jgi:hypothetical protein